MNRRQFLAATGTLGVGTLAGCLSSDLPFVSPAQAFEWHQADEARFVDTRSQSQYDHAHIAGAVFSPAPDGLEENDPAAAWESDTRIVTYCVCPTTLARQRGESLLDDGFSDVHGLDEGFEQWIEDGYPIEGSGVAERLPAHYIQGVSDREHAGEYVWVREPETDQREVSPIEADGTYELELRFVDLTDETLLVVDAPDYTVEGTLAELTTGVVAG